MPKLSPIPLEKKNMEGILDDLWEAITSLQSKREVEDFFWDILTHTERKMLAKRLQIAVMLLKGHSYADIRSSLRVTDHTITKISNWLKTGATGLAKAAKRLIGETRNYASEERVGRKKYLAGDLLIPAVDAGVDLLTRYLKKKRQRKNPFNN